MRKNENKDFTRNDGRKVPRVLQDVLQTLSKRFLRLNNV